MPNTAPDKTPNPATPGESPDATQIPNLDDLSISPPSDGAERVTLRERAPEEDRAAIETAAKELTVEEILSPEGVQTIHRKATGRDITPVKSTLSDADQGEARADLDDLSDKLAQRRTRRAEESPAELDSDEIRENVLSSFASAFRGLTELTKRTVDKIKNR